MSLWGSCVTITLLLSSSTQKLVIYPFLEGVAGGEAGACVVQISLVFNCCQVTACFCWVLLCSLWIYPVNFFKILLAGVSWMSDAGRWDEPAASVQTPLCVLKCLKLSLRGSGSHSRSVRNFFGRRRANKSESCAAWEREQRNKRSEQKK